MEATKENRPQVIYNFKNTKLGKAREAKKAQNSTVFATKIHVHNKLIFIFFHFIRISCAHRAPLTIKFIASLICPRIEISFLIVKHLTSKSNVVHENTMNVELNCSGSLSITTLSQPLALSLSLFFPLTLSFSFLFTEKTSEFYIYPGCIFRLCFLLRNLNVWKRNLVIGIWNIKSGLFHRLESQKEDGALNCPWQKISTCAFSCASRATGLKNGRQQRLPRLLLFKFNERILRRALNGFWCVENGERNTRIDFNVNEFIYGTWLSLFLRWISAEVATPAAAAVATCHRLFISFSSFFLAQISYFHCARTFYFHARTPFDVRLIQELFMRQMVLSTFACDGFFLLGKWASGRNATNSINKILNGSHLDHLSIHIELRYQVLVLSFSLECSSILFSAEHKIRNILFFCCGVEYAFIYLSAECAIRISATGDSRQIKWWWKKYGIQEKMRRRFAGEIRNESRDSCA